MKVKFPTAHGIGEIRGDQVLTRECYQAAQVLGQNHTWMIDEPELIPEPSEAPQGIEVVLGDSSKVLKIGSALDTRGESPPSFCNGLGTIYIALFSRKFL